MKVVIQCADDKKSAETFTLNDYSVRFVATPDIGLSEACPWDRIPSMAGQTWIDCARAYGNPSNWQIYQNAGIGISGNGALMQCGDLYAPPAYGNLLQAIGKENVYILSAGWGLIRANYGIPPYNVTFCNANNVPENAKISPPKRANYLSFGDIVDGDDEIHLFITAKYFAYWELNFINNDRHADRIILHWRKGQSLPLSSPLEDQVVHHDCGNQRQNWHYTAVKQFLKDFEHSKPPASDIS